MSPICPDFRLLGASYSPSPLLLSVEAVPPGLFLSHTSRLGVGLWLSEAIWDARLEGHLIDKGSLSPMSPLGCNNLRNQTIVWIIRFPCSQSNDCMDYQISLFTIKRLYGLSDFLVHNQTIVWIIRFPCSQSNDCMDYQISLFSIKRFMDYQISLFTIKRLCGLSDFLVHNQTIVWIIRFPCSQSNDCMDYQISLFTIKRLYGLSDFLVHNQTIVWIIRFPCSQSNDCVDYQIRRNNLLPSFTLRVSKVRICVIAVVSLLYCVCILIKKTI